LKKPKSQNQKENRLWRFFHDGEAPIAYRYNPGERAARARKNYGLNLTKINDTAKISLTKRNEIAGNTNETKRITSYGAQ
jgi:hypothetical protein